VTNTTIIFIKVITTASSNRLSQIKIDDQQEITCTAHLTAAPEKGKANASLIKLLSKTFNIKQANIEILRGHTSNKKVLSIANISPESLSICHPRT
jgi:uncharacterized protein (TIGR00251 family)